jgi:predicted peptidase
MKSKTWSKFAGSALFLMTAFAIQNCGSPSDPAPTRRDSPPSPQAPAGTSTAPSTPAPGGGSSPAVAPAPASPATGSSWEPPPVPSATPGTFVEVNWTCSTGRQMNYRLLSPAAYDPAKYKYPIVTVLHDKGADVLSNSPEFIDQVGSVYNIAATRQKFPAFVLAPQAWDGDDWGQSYPSAPQAGNCGRELLHQVVTNYSVDLKRLYVTGGWMGGAGVWDWLAREPEFFAAGLPQGGSVMDATFAPKLKDMPIWAFYGSFQYGGGHLANIQGMVDAIKNEGGTQVQLTVSPLGDPAGMYGPWNINPLRAGVLDWMFSQRHK